MMRGASNQIAFGTPRVDDRMHITFLQTGGVIDKDFPKATGGYNLEICESAVTRILQNIPAGFTHDVHTVCRKEASDICLEDRQSMVETIRRINSSKFIVTHGVESMIETAHFLAATKGLLNKTIVVTGASKPQKFLDSDASFNIGATVGALNVLGTGVFLCMNGRIYEANKVRRDGRTGLFVAL